MTGSHTLQAKSVVIEATAGITFKVGGSSLVIDSQGIVWYVDYARGYLGRLDPESREVKEWANPGGPDSRGREEQPS